MIVCSDGRASWSAYVVLVVPPEAPAPRVESARVILTHPTRLPRRAAPVRSSGPRRPDQMRWRERPPPVDLPDGRSALQTQRVIVDPEWLDEVKRKAEPT
jgi:hypothetical protein